MQKMHEKLQNSIPNLSMNSDSRNSSRSKSTHKKSSFYQHSDPLKLNYYSRFSPNRKKLDEEFESQILAGNSPLSPRSSRSSSLTKRSNISVQKLPRQNESKQINKVEDTKIKPINEPLLVVLSKNHSERNEIYIDDEEQSPQIDGENQAQFISKNLFKNVQFPQKNSLESALNLQTMHGQETDQKFKESSGSQSNKSFQKIVQPSSSSQNDDLIVMPKISTGFQILIQDDDDSQDFSSKVHEQPSKIKEDKIVILDDSEQHVLKIAQRIGAVKNQKKVKESRQVKSQSASFSIDSELSMIEEKWNSLFETENNLSESSEGENKHKLFSETISQIEHANKNEKYDEQKFLRKFSDSSEDELPSFSNPNSEIYANFDPISKESRNQESLGQSELGFGRFQREQEMNEEQKKQFKRQYTFGNELNSLRSNSDQNLAQNESKKNIPLFMKFMSKEVIQNFAKTKGKIIKNKNSVKKEIQKTEPAQKTNDKAFLKSSSKIYDIKRPLKPNNLSQKDELQKSGQKNVQIEQKVHQNTQNESILSNQILIEQDQGDSDESIQLANPFDDADDNSDLDFVTFRKNQGTDESENKEFRQKVFDQKVSSPKISHLDAHSISKDNWKNNFEKIIKRQRNISKQGDKQTYFIQNSQFKQQQYLQSEKNLQNQEQIPKFLTNSSDQLFANVDFIQSSPKIQNSKPEKQPKPISNQSTLSYAKIHSKKGLYIGKAKTQILFDKPKPSPRCQDSENNDDNQSYNQSHPKGSEKESMTTTTEQNANQFQTQTYYNPKRKNNGIEEVQNLKKYLQKMEESSKNQEKLKIPQHNIEINQSLEEIQTQRSSIPDYAPFEKFKNDFVSQDFANQTRRQQPQTPEKSQKPSNQLKSRQSNYFQQKIPKQAQNFQKSLKMLQDLIPSLPEELVPLYQKIYKSVYEQELKYEKRIQKQKFLLSFMEQFVKGEKQRIDCSGFLSSDNLGLQSTKQIKVSTDDEDTQIFINKHIILALVRRLSSG